jgi:hypothetical protein
MSPLDISRAVTFATADDFYAWLTRNGSEEHELMGVRRLIAEERMTPAGLAVLPEDL